tara:strand:- start:1869 stop:2033 length:165 start_codon:yes stop_codon:yes gene_type:complete
MINPGLKVVNELILEEKLKENPNKKFIQYLQNIPPTVYMYHIDKKLLLDQRKKI